MKRLNRWLNSVMIGVLLISTLGVFTTATLAQGLTPQQLEAIEVLRYVTNQSSEGLTIQEHPDGSRSVNLEDRFMQVSVAHRTDAGVEVTSLDNFDEIMDILGIDTAQLPKPTYPLQKPASLQRKVQGQPLRLGTNNADIIIVNTDDPGEGFNDPTPVTPVGGNPGTTLGEQRMNLFMRAAEIWANAIDSNVEIRIQASFRSMLCTPNGAILGQGGALDARSDFPAQGGFPGAEFSRTWYPIALANKRSGVDLNPAPSPDGDDIFTAYNSDLDLGCYGGTTWYYGLDYNAPPNQIDFLVVLLHEFAHGLGFANLVYETTGENLLEQTDIFSWYTFDKTLGQYWSEFDPTTAGDATRQASSVNTNNVIWDGPAVMEAIPNYVGHPPHLVINSPAAIAGEYEAIAPVFGAAVTITGTTGVVALYDDGVAPNNNGCEPAVNGGELAGKIALIDRGACTFVVKVANAQAAGAIAVLIANNAPTGLPGMGGYTTTVTIPSLGISQAAGNAIKAQLENDVNVTLAQNPNVWAALDEQGKILLFTPNPVQQGSSMSHWDATATPNLLMEPSVNSDLPYWQDDPLDMTPALLRDIGWYPDANLDGYADDQSVWDKQIWINDEAYKPLGTPYTVLDGDVVTVVDRVRALPGQPLTATLVETWTAGLDFVTYTLDAALPGVVTMGDNQLEWSVSDGISNTWHTLTKTFTVNGQQSFDSSIVEQLTVAGDTLPHPDITLYFHTPVLLSKTGPAMAQSGDVVPYTLTITTPNGIWTPAILTDTLPAGIVYTGGLQTSYGSAWYSDVTKSLYWYSDEPVLFREGFEDGVMPPPGWSVAASPAATRHWQVIPAPTLAQFIRSGQYAAAVPWEVADQDEWLISPAVDLSDVPNPQVEFWFLSTDDWVDYAELQFLVIDSGGTFTDTLWWQSENTLMLNVYRQVQLDLSNYITTPVRLAWRYVGNNGDSVFLDDIMVFGDAPQTITLTFNAELTGAPGQVVINTATLDYLGVMVSDSQATRLRPNQIYLPFVLRAYPVP